MKTFNMFVTEDRKAELHAIIADRDRKIQNLSKGVGLANNAAAIKNHQVVIAGLRAQLKVLTRIDAIY